MTGVKILKNSKQTPVSGVKDQEGRSLKFDKKKNREWGKRIKRFGGGDFHQQHSSRLSRELRAGGEGGGQKRKKHEWNV